MLLVDCASSKNVLLVNSGFNFNVNSKANLTANKTLLIVMLIFCLAYFIFIYLSI